MSALGFNPAVCHPASLGLGAVVPSSPLSNDAAGAAGESATAATALSAAEIDVRGLGMNLHPAAMLPSKVYMRDPAAVRAKLTRLAAGGLSDVFCVSDFDATMTTPEGLSSWCVLERSHFTSDGYRARTRELFNTYYPCEIDPALTLEQKIGKMVEWWGGAEQALIGERLPEGIFARMVAAVEDRVVFRSGCQELLRACERAAVPFLVFSAGVANVIEEVLESKGLMLRNMHVISNRVAFTGGVASHFSSGAPIHVFNKHVGLIAGTPFEREVLSRRGVLLFGDSLGDVTMSSDCGSDGGAATVLRVGYLNTGVGKRVEDHLARYAAAFDVVLVGDGTMTFPLQLMRAVAGDASVEDVMALNANVDIESAVSAGEA